MSDERRGARRGRRGGERRGERRGEEVEKFKEIKAVSTTESHLGLRGEKCKGGEKGAWEGERIEEHGDERRAEICGDQEKEKERERGNSR